MSMEFDKDGWPVWIGDPGVLEVTIPLREYRELKRGYRACRLKCGSLIRQLATQKQELYDEKGRYVKNDS
jgi:hypothetical protein